MTQRHRLTFALWSFGLIAACSGRAETPASDKKPAEKASATKQSAEKKTVTTAAADAGASDHQDEPQGHEELPSQVRLSDEVVRRAGIKIAPVATEALPHTLSLTGQIIADPDRSAKITLRVPARIVDVKYKEGDRVKAGATVAIIESPELARARANLATTQAKAAAARLNFERVSSIAHKGLASGQELAAAEADARTAEAELRAARETVAAFGAAGDRAGDAARLEVRTPVGGFVLQRDGVRGQTVPAEYVVMTVADLDHAFFVARLFEKDLARIKVGAAAEVRLNAYPDDVFEGVVESIGRQLDPTARTVTARIAVKNREDRIKVGLFGTALVVVEDATPRTPRPVVPLSAVTDVANRKVVFVREPDGDFAVHPVTLGRSAAGRVEVLSGVRAGEKVVTEGSFTLKSAVLKSTFGEEE